MTKRLFCFLLLTFLNQFSYGQVKSFNYGTNNAEALQYYEQGWEYILDKGEWQKAEEAFRLAVAKDPGFHLGWSQVGRISHDPEERTAIFAKLNKQKEKLNGWEKGLLEVYLASLEIIDAKDRGIPITQDKVKEFYQTSEKNFSGFLKNFPNERYVHAEYIEVIQGIYGAKAALDSLEKQQREDRELIPFLISYKAQLLAETKQFEEAYQATEALEKELNNPDLPIIHFTYTYIAFEKGDFKEAGNLIDKTLSLDPDHVIAQRLQQKIQDQLKPAAK
ncbi:type IV pilus biogenesis/stability protein PilW [Shivajiella indica]|uniref:Type IV pilus biogenesis/stability protein PilW n=1 Tax=Shivajiella indica TaxID=872115 RepID=A0ABW5BAM2_9BACT